MRKMILVIALMILPLTPNSLFAEALPKGADFSLQDTQDNTVSLSDYKDKHAVLLVFWTTWCPFCRKELVSLKNRYPELKKDGVELLAVNVGEGVEKVERFIKPYNFPFPILLDQETSVSRAFGIMGVPSYILIDKKSEIVFQDNSFPEQAYKDLISK